MSHPECGTSMNNLLTVRNLCGTRGAMIQDAHHHRPATNAFRAWRSLVGADLTEAARLLGKSKRIVEYYDAGTRPVPVDTRKLMQAIVERGDKGEIQPWPETATGSRP